MTRFFLAGTILCVFLRGVGVVGQAPAQDMTDPSDEKGLVTEADQK
jgi:hypothetical protein